MTPCIVLFAVAIAVLLAGILRQGIRIAKLRVPGPTLAKVDTLTDVRRLEGDGKTTDPPDVIDK